MSGETEKQVSGWTVDTLKEHLEGLISYLKDVSDERDRLYKERHDSADKAIIKAETAQREYNERSNEFRGQLDDQAKRLVSRLEVESMIKEVEARIARNVEDIREIREKTSAGGGVAVGTRMVKDERRADRAGMISMLGSIMTFIGLLVVLWKLSVGR